MISEQLIKSPFKDDQISIWIICISVIVCFGALALFLSFKHAKEYSSSAKATEFFFTARDSLPLWKITWSIYSSSLGAWTLFGPASMSIISGAIGMCAYCVSIGLAINILAFSGNKLQKKFHKVSNFGEYALLRYGHIPQFVVSLIMIFNMAVALTAEYTMISFLFNVVLNIHCEPFVVIIGTVTMLYTAFGGLYISILTDQIQAIFCISLLAVFLVLLLLNGDFGVKKSYKDLNIVEDYGSLIYMPISIISSTTFSEALWQRVWASSNSKTLRRSALISSILATLLLLLFGFGGLLAYWKNPGEDKPERANTILFELIFQKDNNSNFWIGLVVTVMAVTMNVSAVDSLQNALISSLHSLLLKRQPLLLSRLAVVVINVPTMVLGLKMFNLMSIFSFSNLLTASFLFPIMFSLFDKSSSLVSGFGAIFGGLFGLLSLVVYRFTYCMQDDYTFLGYFLNFRPFIITIFSSIVGTHVWILVEKLYEKVFGKELRMRGFRTCNDFINGGFIKSCVEDSSDGSKEKKFFDVGV